MGTRGAGSWDVHGLAAQLDRELCARPGLAELPGRFLFALDDGRAFLMGDQFTSADILLTTCLEWAIAYEVGICDIAKPYLARIQQRPGYQRGKAANVPPAAGEPVIRPA